MIDTEILTAIDELKSGKAEGCDGIPAELLKVLGERGKVPSGSMQEYLRECKMTGRFYKSDSC